MEITVKNWFDFARFRKDCLACRIIHLIFCFRPLRLMTLFGRGMFLGKLEKHQRSGVYLSERLASLGIIWDQLGTHLKLLKITALCGIEGSKGGPTIMGAAEVSFPAVPKMKNCFQQQKKTRRWKSLRTYEQQAYNPYTTGNLWTPSRVSAIVRLHMEKTFLNHVKSTGKW